MAKIKQVFIADDGAEFDTETAADAHNASIEAGGAIEAFITDQSLGKAQAGLMRRLLAQFVAFQNREDFHDLVMAANERLATDKVAKAEAAEAAKAAAKEARAAARAAKAAPATAS